MYKIYELLANLKDLILSTVQYILVLYAIRLKKTKGNNILFSGHISTTKKTKQKL